MGRILVPLIIVALAVIGGFIAYQHVSSDSNKSGDKPMDSSKTNLTLQSSAFVNGQPIPATYSCNGANFNPPLTISGVPDDAASLVLIVHDPDAPSGDFLHWSVWNIPANTTLIASQSLPSEAIEGTNDFGQVGYGGPCPPSGTHHYHFDLYALDKTLDLPRGAKRGQLQAALSAHTLAKASLIGTFTAQTQQ